MRRAPPQDLMPLWSFLSPKVTNLSSLLIMLLHFPSHFGLLLITASRSYAPVELPFRDGDKPLLTAQHVVPLRLMVMGSLLRAVPPHVDNPVGLSPMPYCCDIESACLMKYSYDQCQHFKRAALALRMSLHFPWSTPCHCAALHTLHLSPLHPHHSTPLLTTPTLTILTLTTSPSTLFCPPVPTLPCQTPSPLPPPCLHFTAYVTILNFPTPPT